MEGHVPIGLVHPEVVIGHALEVLVVAPERHSPDLRVVIDERENVLPRLGDPHGNFNDGQTRATDVATSMRLTAADLALAFIAVRRS